MGTHALIKVYDENVDLLTTIYHHYDGYPSGVGRDLAEFLLGRIVVRGFDDIHKPVANGMDNLAAQIIYYLVQMSGSMVGNVYIEVPSDGNMEAYMYEVFFGGNDKEIKLACTIAGNLEFLGPPAEMLEWITKTCGPTS
jgi:hypothetical protein